MTQPLLPVHTASTAHEDLAARIAAEVAACRYSVTPNFVTPAEVAQMRAEAQAGWEEGDFITAKIGTGATRQFNPQVRSDRIAWWPEVAQTAAQQMLHARYEALRTAINRATMLGLYEWEGHWALYLNGCAYRRHLDVFAQAKERKISTILYLNPAWEPAHGGELAIYTDGESLEQVLVVPPVAGTLVCFLSEEVYHEVRVSHAPRYSVTGWFRVREMS